MKTQGNTAKKQWNSVLWLQTRWNQTSQNTYHKPPSLKCAQVSQYGKAFW